MSSPEHGVVTWVKGYEPRQGSPYRGMCNHTNLPIPVAFGWDRNHHTLYQCPDCGCRAWFKLHDCGCTQCERFDSECIRITDWLTHRVTERTVTVRLIPLPSDLPISQRR